MDTKAEVPRTMPKEEGIKYSLYSACSNRHNNSRFSLRQIIIWFILNNTNVQFKKIAITCLLRTSKSCCIYNTRLFK